MRISLLAFFVFLMHACTYAQNQQWVIRIGQSIYEALGDSVIFLYPHFTPGTVRFRNGTVSNARLNLHLITGEMEFVNSANDTMAVTNEATIRHITIGADTFYFDKVYVQLIYSNAVAKLAKLQVIVPVNVQKQGAYDQPYSAGSISAASAYYQDNQVYKLSENKERTLRKETVFFIGNPYNHFLPATKKNIYAMFNKQKEAIEAFIKENKIELNKKDDLLKLVDALENL